MRVVLEEQPALVWSFMGSQVLPEDLHYVGSTPQAAVPTRSLFQCDTLWPLISFRACPPAVAGGPPQAAVWISALPWSFMGCRGTTCFTMGFTMVCRGISALVSQTSLPPSILTLESAELYHLYFPTALLQMLCSIFYPFLSVLSQRCHQ